MLSTMRVSEVVCHVDRIVNVRVIFVLRGRSVPRDLVWVALALVILSAAVTPVSWVNVLRRFRMVQHAREMLSVRVRFAMVARYVELH